MRSWPQASAEVNRDKWLIIVLPVARRCRMAGSAASPQVRWVDIPLLVTVFGQMVQRKEERLAFRLSGLTRPAPDPR